MLGRVLIVDSIATNRIVLQSGLTPLSSEVWQADTLAEGVSLAKAHRVQIVLATMNLPGIEAEELFAAVKTMQPAPLILAVTGSSIKARLSALEAGADSVISHPVDQGLLRAKVRGLLRRLTPVTDDMLPKTLHGLFDPARPFVPAQAPVVLGPDAVLVELYLGQLRRAGITEARHLAWQQSDDRLAPTRLAAHILAVPPETDAGDLRAMIAALRCEGPLFVVTGQKDPALATVALNDGAWDVVNPGNRLAELICHLGRVARVPRDIRLTDRSAQPHLAMRRLRPHDVPTQTNQPYAVLVCQVTPPIQPEGANDGLRRDLETTDTLIQRLLRKGAPYGACLTTLCPGTYALTLWETGGSEARRVALRLCHEVAQTPIWMETLDSTTRFSLSVGIGLSHHAMQVPADKRDDFLVKLAKDALRNPTVHMQRDTDVHFGRPAA